MIGRLRHPLILLAALSAAPVAAQTDTTLLARGVQAYNDVDFDAAVGLLRRWLDGTTSGAPPTLQVRALSYLGAAELLRGNNDSAAAAFARLVRVAPRATIDVLVFPPAIAQLFAAVRSRTRLVNLEAPPVSDLGDGDTWSVLVAVSTPHTITVDVRRPDGEEVRTVYRGLVGDTLRIRWDGHDPDGNPLLTGGYLLEVRSFGPSGTLEHVAQLPLEIETHRLDTLSHPLLPDSLFRRERREAGPGLEALAGGLLAGLAIAVLPSTFAPKVDLNSTRFAVAGAVSITGLIGLLRQRPGGVLTENRAYNEAIREGWRRRVDELVAENAARRAGAGMVIRTGTLRRVDLQGP